MFKKVHIIVNPASGSDQPILNKLNAVFHPAEVDWDVSVTHKAGDASRFARQAFEAGYDLVAAYGGDGTVMEVAQGLMGTGAPLAILPGGTANVLSVELGIPGDLSKAAALIVDGPQRIRTVDMGLLNEKHLFILRFATGFEAEMVKTADRKMKDRFGKLSYTLAGILSLGKPLHAHYRFILDGEKYECDGVSCMVANTSNLGLPGLNASNDTDVSDGLLDVIVFSKSEHSSLMSLLTFGVNVSDDELRKEWSKVKLMSKWKAKEISVEADPPQNMIIDGEILGSTPCQIKVVPGAVNILVPDSGPA